MKLINKIFIIIISIFILFVLNNQHSIYILEFILDIISIPKYLKKKIIFIIKKTIFINTHSNQLIRQDTKINNKRNITNLQKKIVASNQSWLCNICKKTLDYSYEVDHIIALCDNGTNEINNLQALCRNCHGIKTLNRYN